jgi:hypothetical protein
MLDIDKSRQVVSAGVTVSALSLAAFGALLVLAPDEVSDMLTPAGGATIIAQVCGAAMLGFAVMNWTARGSALGGIYGRALVVGNQMHFMVGALLLVTSGSQTPRHPAYWVLAGMYIFGAAFFTYLMFFSSGLRKP